MVESVFVKHAKDMAHGLVLREFAAGRDVENAMRRAATRWNIPYGTLWALRYRTPRDLMTSVYFRLLAAHEATRGQQQKQFEHELAIARATGADASLVRAAVAVAGVQDEGQG